MTCACCREETDDLREVRGGAEVCEFCAILCPVCGDEVSTCDAVDVGGDGDLVCGKCAGGSW